MKLSITIEGLGSLPRFDAKQLTARLQSEFERELQAAAAASKRPLDPVDQRAALDRALARLNGSAR
jgi:hypothetical protein